MKIEKGVETLVTAGCSLLATLWPAVVAEFESALVKPKRSFKRQRIQQHNSVLHYGVGAGRSTASVGTRRWRGLHCRPATSLPKRADF